MQSFSVSFSPPLSPSAVWRYREMSAICKAETAPSQEPNVLTWFWTSWPPELWEINAFRLSHSICGILLQQPKPTRTPVWDLRACQARGCMCESWSKFGLGQNPLDRGAWQAPGHGVAKSQTRLKQHSSHADKRLPWGARKETQQKETRAGNSC